MKICCIADQHGHFPDIEPCDLLIIAGDMVDAFRNDYDGMMKWYDFDFRHWLRDLPAGEIVGVAGNHDFMYEREPEHMKALDLPWIYLEDEPYKYMNYNIWGSPWQRVFGNWAFNDYDDDNGLGRRFNRIPLDTDILITHSPPYGIGDKTFQGENVGSHVLRRRVNEVKPTLHVFGHIHPARGFYNFNRQTQVNASYLLYDGPEEPIYLSLPDK